MDDPPAAFDETKKRAERGPAMVRDGEYYGDVVLSLQVGPDRMSRRRSTPTYPGDLRPYSHVEVALVGPDDALAIPSSLGLPKELDAHFTAGPSSIVAGPLSWQIVNELRQALIQRCDRLGRFDPY